jgi:hypothetical protein
MPEHEHTSPGPSLPNSKRARTMRAGARNASRTDLAHRREPFSDAGLQMVTRPCHECSLSVESVCQRQAGGHRANGPAPDTRR